jgi:hypothetical protein
LQCLVGELMVSLNVNPMPASGSKHLISVKFVSALFDGVLSTLPAGRLSSVCLCIGFSGF